MFNIVKKIQDFIIPPTCIYCKKIILDEHAICQDCFMQIHFIGEPSCYDCGADIPYVNSCCLGCFGQISEQKYYDTVRCLFHYDDFSKKAILKLKHGDGGYIAKFFSKMIYNRYKEVFEHSDLIMYIPIHYKRLLFRRYNQCALIANHLSLYAKRIVSHNNLIRVKNTKQQKGNLRSRYNNLKNAFSIKNGDELCNKNIILIDDVFTTGATINECSKIIKMSGAKTVNCLCLARAAYNFI